MGVPNCEINVSQVRHYKLFQGEVNRFMGFYKKGMTTDSEEMENQTPRECILICKRLVEVLVLHKQDYFNLIKYGQGPPLDFLRRISLFRDFPCEQFLDNPEAINLRYYGRGKTVIEDSSFTSWIHVVKSGTVKVVRRQKIYNTEQKRLFGEKDVEKIGTTSFKGHADAMMGVGARQRKFKSSTHSSSAAFESVRLPSLTSERSLVHQPGYKRPDNRKQRPGRRSSTLLTEMLRQRKSTNPDIPEEVEFEEVHSPIPDKDHEEVLPEMEIIRNANFPPDITVTDTDEVGLKMEQENNDHVEVIDTGTIAEVEEEEEEDTPKRTRPSIGTMTKAIMKMRVNSPLFRIARKSSEPRSSMGGGWGTYITTAARTARAEAEEREKNSEVAEVLTGRRNKDRTERDTFVQLDTLRPLDAFGFYKIAEWKGNIRMGKKTGLALVSEGAEVIRISKRFFLQVARNNTLLKVHFLNKDYLTQTEVKKSIEDRRMWDTYKSVLLQRMVEIHS